MRAIADLVRIGRCPLIGGPHRVFINRVIEGAEVPRSFGSSFWLSMKRNTRSLPIRDPRQTLRIHEREAARFVWIRMDRITISSQLAFRGIRLGRKHNQTCKHTPKYTNSSSFIDMLIESINKREYERLDEEALFPRKAQQHSRGGMGCVLCLELSLASRFSS